MQNIFTRRLYLVVFCMVFWIFSAAESHAQQRAVILGRIYQRVPQSLQCELNRYYFGDNCGQGQCRGNPGYSVTWTQGSQGNTIRNNSCWYGLPRYTFENTSNPVGTSEGRTVAVTVRMDDPNVRLTSWSRMTSRSNGVACRPSEGGSLVQNADGSYSISLTVYRDGDCQWNHLWFKDDTLPTGAQCVGHTIPNGMTAGETRAVSVTMRNLADPWVNAGGNMFALGSAQPRDNLIWGINRIPLSGTVGQNETHTFNFSITAPLQAGTYSSKWQMTASHVGWFGEMCGPDQVVVSSSMPTHTPSPLPTATPSPVPPTLTPTPVPPTPTTIPACWTTCPSVGVVSGSLQCLDLGGQTLWRNHLCPLDSDCVCDPTSTPTATPTVVLWKPYCPI